MCSSLLILLLIAGALLISTEGQQDYHSLPSFYKDTVNKAIQHGNQKSLQHLNFVAFLPDSERPDPFYIELHLKATNCTKSEKITHRDDCQFMERRPRINCAVCNNQRTGLFIHCAPQQKVKQFEEFRKNECIGHKVLAAEPTAPRPEISAPPPEITPQGPPTGPPGPPEPLEP
ncbi:hypothetical protein COCON_G00136220 [Conger conger]|uniref:Chemerin n=1 Tax=Conger conger TaxID=82655 RepID=A0A9Q1HX48_CONCO|nr:hypothetical protein COCON_G00136220 [Conger conger]